MTVLYSLQSIFYVCSSGECVSMENVCNGYADCEDGSDESETKCKVACLLGYYENRRDSLSKDSHLK